VFTQVLEMARGMKLGRLGQVAIDSTRIQAAASRNRLETEERLRQERAQPRRNIRKWQKQCDEEDPNEGAGTRLQRERLQEQLQEMPRRLEKLRKSGMKKRSRTDEDARFLRERDGFALGYTAEVAVNEDHLIVGQRVTQNSADNHSLIPIGGRSGTTERSEGGESSGRRRVFLAGKHHRTGRPRVGCVRAGFELGTGVEHGTALSANPAQQNPAAYAAEVARANRTSGLSATQGFSRTGAGKLKRTTRNEAISVTGIGESEPRVHPGCHLVQSDPDPGQPLAGPPYIAMSATGPHRQRVLTRSLKPRWSHLAG